MAANTAQGAGQLYDWGDGRGRVHSRPKKTQAPKPQSIYGRPIWGGMGQMGKPGPAPGYTGPGSGAPQPQALPADPAFEAQQLANNRNLQVGTAYGAWQNANTTYDTGYNAQGQRDYSNPYNQAALLDESYKRSKSGTLNSYASSGQLHSGAYGRMQGENDRNFSIASNQLQTDAARQYQSGSFDQLGNIANYGTSNDQGAFEALLRALGVK